jgi:hypothetical protein
MKLKESWVKSLQIFWEILAVSPTEFIMIRFWPKRKRPAIMQAST